jgi:alpha-glucoside transport system permease protein
MATKKNAGKRQKLTRDILINGTLAFIVLIWTIPIIGLLVSSFRDRFEIQTSGWWTIFPHKELKMVEEFPIPEGLDRNSVMEMVAPDFEEFGKASQSMERSSSGWATGAWVSFRCRKLDDEPNLPDNYKEVWADRI